MQPSDPSQILVIAHIPPAFRTALERRHVLVDHVIEGTDRSADDLPRGHVAVLTRAVFGLPFEVMDALPSLGLVLSVGAGLEQIDTDELARRGITLVHTPDETTEDVADFALGLIYAVERGIVQADRALRSGNWAAGRSYRRRACTLRIGIVGFGRIGSRIAEKATALGMTVSYFNRSSHPVPYRRYDALTDMARAVDALIVTCAGTSETYHIVNAAVLDALGAEGFLVNVSRGSVVDEAALIAALQSGTLGAGALDVFASEPDIDPRLLGCETLVLTPHAASLTLETREAMAERLCNGAATFFAQPRLDRPA